MGNKLREMLSSSNQKKVFENMIRQSVDEKMCSMCVNSYSKPHYEHGLYGGEDYYCSFSDDFRNGENAKDCSHWKQK